MKKIIALLFCSTFLLSACDNKTPSTPSSSSNPNLDTKVTFIKVKDIIDQRCATCHSKSNGLMQGGISFDTPEQIVASAQRIKARAVISKDMPKTNKTNMTQEERDLIGKWVDQGASNN
ncbi:MAG: hypothetical protein U0354_10975 [Candidatus Sericytochromatia bacterium]